MVGRSDTVPGSREWIAHCGSFSKILSPGLRVGWLIAQPALLANATMCKQFSDAHTSTLTQATAAHYLTLGRMDTALGVVRKTYAERARVMAACLRKELGNASEFNQPQGVMFFCAKLTEVRNATAFAQLAIDYEKGDKWWLTVDE